MWTFLLNPKNLAIIALCVLLVVTFGAFQWEKIAKAKLQNAVDALQGQVDSLATQIAIRDSIIEDQKKNLDAAMASVKEMQLIIAQASTIRKKIKVVSALPTGKACETSDKLGADYAKMANDITGFIVYGVRGKVSAPRPDNSEAPAEAVR